MILNTARIQRGTIGISHGFHLPRPRFNSRCASAEHRHFPSDYPPARTCRLNSHATAGHSELRTDPPGEPEPSTLSRVNARRTDVSADRPTDHVRFSIQRHIRCIRRTRVLSWFLSRRRSSPFVPRVVCIGTKCGAKSGYFAKNTWRARDRISPRSGRSFSPNTARRSTWSTDRPAGLVQPGLRESRERTALEREVNAPPGPRTR